MVRRHRHLLLMTDTSPLPTSYKHEFLLHKCQRGCSVSIQGSCLFALHALHAALALETFSGQFWPRPRLSSLLGMARRRRGGGGGGLAGLAIGLLGKLFGCVAAQVEVAKADDTDAIKSKNDYELVRPGGGAEWRAVSIGISQTRLCDHWLQVVRASKELEHVLEASLGAQGKGRSHPPTTPLPAALVLLHSASIWALLQSTCRAKRPSTSCIAGLHEKATSVQRLLSKARG